MDRRRDTDGRHAISIPRYALVHRAVKAILKTFSVAISSETLEIRPVLLKRCVVPRLLLSDVKMHLAVLPEIARLSCLGF